MSYLPKNIVAKKIKKIRRRSKTASGGFVDGYEAYFGVDPVTHSPKRIFRTTLEDLKREIRDFYMRMSSGGEMAARLTVEQAIDAQNALRALSAAGADISLTDAVGAFLEGRGRECAQPSETVASAFRKYLDSMCDKSPPYQKDIRLRVGGWVQTFGGERPLSAVSAPEVKRYLMDRFYRKGDIGSWVTYNGYLGNIKSFVAWCASVEQGMIPSSPLAGMKKLEIPYRQPAYMKAADVKKVFMQLWDGRNENPTDLAHMVLSFFCGMRQSEIERARDGESAVKISLDERFIRIGLPKGATKGVRPRTFAIPEQALAWMRAFDFMDAVARPAPKLREKMTAFCRGLGIKFPKNAGRHTFITMFEATHHDANALSAIVGNTEDVRAKSYNGVELKREGEAYFKILPPEA